jgi:hypothetical protein
MSLAKLIKVTSFLLVIVLAAAFSGCTPSVGSKKKAEEEAQLEEVQEVIPTIEALPKKDKPGEDMPGVARPPKSVRIATELQTKDGEKYGRVIYISRASSAEVRSFYQDELSKKGWKLGRELETSLKGLPGALLDFEQGELRFEVEIEEGKTKKGEKFVYVKLKRFQKI